MFGLSFLSPWLLAGLAAVAAPFVLHLFARETAPLADFPMARFVPRAAVHQTRRRRLQDLLLLALRALAVVLLALVFARPFVERPLVAGQDTLRVLAVDRSFSMGGRREAEMRRAARAALDAQPAGAPVALVAFDHDAQVVVGPTSSRGELAAAIDGLRAGFGGTSYAAAVRAALDLARRRPAVLTLVTDGQRAGADAEALPPVPEDLQLVLRLVPPPPENLSVDLLERDDDALVALVRNHGLEDRRTRVRWTGDGAALAEAWVDVPAGAARETRLDRRVPARAVVTALIDDAAGFEADNARYLVTDPAAPLLVWLVRSVDAATDAGLYVRAALEAATGDTPVAVTALTADDARLADPAALATARVIVIVGTRGMGRAARELIARAVREGRGLLVAAGAEVEAGVVRESLGLGDRLGDAAASDATTESLAAADVRHPVLASLGETAGNLGQIRVERAWTLRDLPGATTLLTLSSGRPALAEFPLGRGRVFLASTDLGRRWNSWPLHPTFVPFVVESVRYLSGRPAQRRDVLVATAGAGGDAHRPGAVTQPSGERVAVNVDPRESRIEQLTEAEFLAGLERLPVSVDGHELQSEAERGQSLWRYVLFALLAVLALEALVAGRERQAAPGAGAWADAEAAVPGSAPSLPIGGPRA